MGSSGAKPATFFFLFVNLVLYLIITIIASWLVNHGIQDSLEQGINNFLGGGGNLFSLLGSLFGKERGHSPANTSVLVYRVASVLSIPARIFPIYYPFGNMATAYVVIFSLLAGVVGFTTSLTGMSHAAQWNASDLYAASASSLITWSFTLLAMGFACKEIDIGWSGSTLRVLEVALNIVYGTQLLGMIAIHAGIEELSRYRGGIV